MRFTVLAAALVALTPVFAAPAIPSYCHRPADVEYKPPTELRHKALCRIPAEQANTTLTSTVGAREAPTLSKRYDNKFYSGYRLLVDPRTTIVVANWLWGAASNGRSLNLITIGTWMTNAVAFDTEAAWHGQRNGHLQVWRNNDLWMNVNWNPVVYDDRTGSTEDFVDNDLTQDALNYIIGSAVNYAASLRAEWMTFSFELEVMGRYMGMIEFEMEAAHR
jgi:hypothetical protein